MIGIAAKYFHRNHEEGILYEPFMYYKGLVGYEFIISSVNGLVPGTKPLPEPMLAYWQLDA